MQTITKEAMDKILTSNGRSIREISLTKPVLLIFLRHFGCTFCREALDDLSSRQQKIAEEGVEIVVVHMSDDKTAERYFKRFSLKGLLHISDPECNLYQQFGLVKGNFRQLMGLNVWIRGFEAGVMKGLGIGKFIGDGFQMPGIFMIRNGEIRDSYIHKSAADRPDYEALANCCHV